MYPEAEASTYRDVSEKPSEAAAHHKSHHWREACLPAALGPKMSLLSS